ncbi:MAG: DUF6516 family protein [Methanosarcinales archaeon]
MDQEIREYFAEIITYVEEHFENIEIKQDLSERRALLKIKCRLRDFKIKITEVIDEDKRKYSYYLIKNDTIIFGFDNAPDPTALKIKYGNGYKQHRTEYIPHFHGKGKRHTELTEETRFEDFLEEINRSLEEE